MKSINNFKNKNMKKIVLSLIYWGVGASLHAQIPNLTWAKNTFVTGSAASIGNAIAVDAAGNVYTAGGFTGVVDFDPSAGVSSLTALSGSSFYDDYILKYDAAGNFLWVKQFPTNEYNHSVSLTLDASGNPIITGWYKDTADFDPSATTFNLIATGTTEDVFIAKLDAMGNFLWAKSIGGGADDDNAFSIAVDASSNVYTTGKFSGTVDFDPGAGTNTLTAIYPSAFISKLDVAGNFVWAKNLQSGISYSNAIKVDASGNIYTTGAFAAFPLDFDPGIGVFNISPVGSAINSYVTKLDAAGNFVWAKTMSGTDDINPNSIDVDALGNVYTSGWYLGTADLDPSASTYNLTSNGLQDMYISKLDASGNFVWGKSMGGSADDDARSIDVDASGNVYTTGYFHTTVDFDPGAGITNLTTGQKGGFVSKLSSAGNFVWVAEFANGGGRVDGTSITLDGASNIYTTGNYLDNCDFDPSAAVFNLLGSSFYNQSFIHKMLDIAGSASIQTNSLSSSISIYPNPNNGTFTVTVDQLEENNLLQVYNVLGEKMYEAPITSYVTSLNLNTPAGIYFVTIIDGNGNKASKKIIVK
jgi:Secretion system C-terminal sorting domain